MKNDTFSTPEILDVTAVELAKLQQDGDTKRKQISEREITIRAKNEASKSKWTDSGFQTVVGVIGLSFIIASGFAAHNYIEKRWTKSDPCIESHQVSRDGAKLACSGGAHLETKPLGDRGDIELRCVCK